MVDSPEPQETLPEQMARLRREAEAPFRRRIVYGIGVAIGLALALAFVELELMGFEALLGHLDRRYAKVAKGGNGKSDFDALHDNKMELRLIALVGG